MVSVDVKRGKVVIRFGDHQCTIGPVQAAKLALKLHDASKKAAKQAGRFQEV